MLDIMYQAFYKYEELAAFLEEAQNDYPQLVTVKSLVKTPEGRDVFLVEITDKSTGSSESKSAYYIQANVHAQEGAGTTAALHIIKNLLEEPCNRELLKNIAFYIIPRLNPDGTEYTLTTGGEIRSRLKPIKCKNGLIPQDIDGDGYILTMRWEDPAGPMKEDSVDPRLMVRREPGDTAGPFYHVVTEGLINDYDGTDIVSGMRSIDFNRNWPMNWKPAPGACEFPLEEPEMRAVAEFLVSHRNIFAGLDFHCGNNGILRPTMRPDSEINVEDLGLIINLGRKAAEATGFPLIHESDYKESWKQPMMLYGNSNEFAYFALGISHYVIELGNGFNNAGIKTREYLEADSRTREADYMRRVLAFHDEKGSKLFVPWKEHLHPQLGEVEIGGLIKGNGYFMYSPEMEKVYDGTTCFAIQHAKMHPKLIVSNLKADRIGDNIVRIRAVVGNIGGFSANVMKGGSVNVKEPIKVELELPDNAAVLSANSIFEFSDLEALGGTANVEWFVKASKGCCVIISAYHPKAGASRMKVCT